MKRFSLGTIIAFCCVFGVLLAGGASFAEAKGYKPLKLKDVPKINAAAFTKIVAKEKGKVVVVNIFASWCLPCEIEVPELIQARAAFPESEVVFMGVSMDLAHNEMLDFVNKHKITYPVYIGVDDFGEKVGVAAIPQLLIYNKSGELKIDNVGLVSTDALIGGVKEILAR